jgi:glutathione S-transferase
LLDARADGASGKNLPQTSHHLDLRKKEAVTPEYFGIHPKGLVPALVHDGVVHIESNEIIEYLDETFPDPPLQADLPEEREEIRDWLRTATEIHLPAVKTLIYTRKIGKVLRKNAEEDAKYRALQRDPELLAFHAAATSGNGLPQENVDKAEATLFHLFDEVESELSEHEWLVGDKLSLADISWVPALQNLKQHFIAGWAGYGIIGTKEQVVDQLALLERAGLDGIVLTWPRYIEDMQRFKAETFPAATGRFALTRFACGGLKSSSVVRCLARTRAWP